MDGPIISSLATPLAAIATESARQPLDAVVIGAGSAGITTARTLVEQGKRVGLIETGPLGLLTHIQSTDLRFDPNLVRTVQQGFQYSPLSADGSPFGALIACVGGRGMFWNGAAPRFKAADFDGWPFGLGDLEPYYTWAEGQFRVTRAYGNGRLGQEVCRRLRDKGIPAEPGPFAVDDHYTADGWLAGTIGNSLAPLLRTTLLTSPTRQLVLAVRSFAAKVLLEQGHVRGVQAIDLETGTSYELFARSVVLAGGAFESVRLAMASGVPDPNGLIGRFISDHIFIRAYYPIDDGLYDPAQPEVAVTWVPAGDGRQYQLEIHLPADNLFLLKESTVWKPDTSAYYAAMVRSFAPVQPRRDNYLELLPGNAPGKFRVHLSLDADDQRLKQTQIAALEQVRIALGAQSAPIQEMPQGASHHEAGGLCLGNDPKSSVADPFGRIRGLSGLLAFDSATWPDVSPANPHLTIVAVARRQALQLASDL